MPVLSLLSFRLANELDRSKIDGDNLRAANGKLMDELRMLKVKLVNNNSIWNVFLQAPNPFFPRPNWTA